MISTFPRPISLSASGEQLDLSPDKFGELLDSSDYFCDAPVLRERMERDGYLFLRGALNRKAPR